MVVLAGCGAQMRFTLFNTANTGTCNDCTAWERSKMKERFDEGKLPLQYYFIADEGLSCEDQMLVPWSGTGIVHLKDSFNYHLSVRRQVIERAFGHLTRRWGIFWRPVDVGFMKWSLVASVCANCIMLALIIVML